MKDIDELADQRTAYTPLSDQFYDARLQQANEAEWPSQIDSAALDLLFNVAIGHSQTSQNDTGGMINGENFGEATGEYYAEGLKRLVDPQSDLPDQLTTYTDEYGTDVLGDLVFRLNEFRHELQRHLSDEGQESSLNRAMEALLEKIATESITQETYRQSLTQPESVTDAMVQLFSDPAIKGYVTDLTETMNRISQSESFLERLDAPHMTTTLWTHQQEALEAWLQYDCEGYVDMATATGKTVLGLAAIAALYGQLHPQDTATISQTDNESLALETHTADRRARVLVVAGNDLLLEQWQSEIDEHLNIPRERTVTTDKTMTFGWGTIEFRSAQELLHLDSLKRFDLVVLDEVHQYSRGGQSRGWNTVLNTLLAESENVLALSGSIDSDWQDQTVKTTLEGELTCCKEFTVTEARDVGVIATFDWDVVYARSAENTATDLVEYTAPLADVYNDDTNTFEIADAIADLPDDVPPAFTTLTHLRSFAQSEKGSNARSALPGFDELATAAFTRRPKRWQLPPRIPALVELIDRHAPDSQCVVLVQSYDQAEVLGEKLTERYGEDCVVVPDKDAGSQFSEIKAFKTRTDGVLIGPAQVLGTGVDLPNAEVAVNVSKGGVNSSLIQRIGRILRNPTGEKEATFYQLVTIRGTQAAVIPGEDGRRLLKRASEYRAFGARLRQFPAYRVADTETGGVIALLERRGAAALTQDSRSIDEIVTDGVSRDFLQEIIDVIQNGEYPDGVPSKPQLTTFERDSLDRTYQPVAAVTGDTPLEEPTGESTQETRNGTLSTDADSEPQSLSETTSTQSRGTTPTDDDTATDSPDDQHPTDLPAMTTQTVTIEVPPALAYLISEELDDSPHDSLNGLADEVIGEYIAGIIEQDEEPFTTTAIPDPTVELSPYLERVIRDQYSDDAPDNAVTAFVQDAVREQLGLESDPVTLEMNLSPGLLEIITSLVKTVAPSETDQTPAALTVAAFKTRFSPTQIDSDDETM